tara:strand:+ start:298 stop:429 length:132 start_codon:yes stop_codon:yes gene_type:complete
MNFMILPVINAKNVRRYVGLAEDKKETDVKTSVNSRDLSWIEH